MAKPHHLSALRHLRELETQGRRRPQRAASLFLRFSSVSLCLCGALISPAAAQDASEIVRRSVELDRNNWVKRADYTWVGHSRERHFDAHNQVTSDRQETWETLILDGLPFTRMLARDGKPLPPAEQRKQQQKLDRETAKLASESPEEKQKRAADF